MNEKSENKCNNNSKTKELAQRRVKRKTVNKKHHNIIIYLHFPSCNNRIMLLHPQWLLLQAHIFSNLSNMYLPNETRRERKKESD